MALDDSPLLRLTVFVILQNVTTSLFLPPSKKFGRKQEKMYFSLSMLAILLLSTVTETRSEEEKSLVEECISKQLVDPWQIEETGEEFIHLALVLSGKDVNLERHAMMADRYIRELTHALFEHCRKCFLR